MYPSKKSKRTTILKKGSVDRMEVEEVEYEDNDKNHKVTWDEATLKYHEKLKGTYIKIDEPKTPYHKPRYEIGFAYFSLAPETEEEAEIASLLAQATANRKKNEHTRPDLAAINAALMKELKYSGRMSEYSEEEDEATRKKKEEFKKKRDMHYGKYFVRATAWQRDSDD